MLDNIKGHNLTEEKTIATVDWELHRFGTGVLCEFRPRADYKGRPTRPGIIEKAGTRFFLRTIWLMDNNDPYPGEYALSTIDDQLLQTLNITWVASGDVVALPKC